MPEEHGTVYWQWGGAEGCYGEMPSSEKWQSGFQWGETGRRWATWPTGMWITAQKLPGVLQLCFSPE